MESLGASRVVGFRIRAVLADQVRRVTTLINELEHRRLDTMMWFLVAVPIIAVFFGLLLRRGQ